MNQAIKLNWIIDLMFAGSKPPTHHKTLVRLIAIGLCCALIICSQPTATAENQSPQPMLKLNQVNTFQYVSGQPDAADFLRLKALGIRNIVSLRPTAEIANFNEAALATQYLMAFYNFPIDEPEQITPKKVATWHSLLETVEGQSTLLHCASGNRVGAMMAANARWTEAASLEDAIRIGEQYGLTRWRHEMEQILK